jgi:HD-GYP domain-containing protein (c-di-GMP phosphodiesterase class II)
MGEHHLKVTNAQDENVNEFARAHSDKLQRMARTLVSSLYMMVRSVKMYEPENEVFKKPLLTLQETCNQIVTVEGKLELVGVKDSFYLNNMLVKVEINAVENLRYLVSEMQAKDVGGFTLTRHVSMDDLKQFIRIFAQPDSGGGMDKFDSGPGLLSMTVTRWTKLQERLAADQSQVDLKVDRKRYALTLYGRAVFFLRRYLDSVREGRPISSSPALRIVQDLVDISFDQRTHFLGLTSARLDDDYLVFHQVNVALMSIVFGSELGFSKQQLRELGYIALFHDAGMANLPATYYSKRGALTDEERKQIARVPLMSVRNTLMEKGFSHAALLRVVTTLEHKVDFGTPVRDARGGLQMVVPKGQLGVYAKVIAICDAFDALTSKRPFREAYGPEVAIMLMWSEMRHKFDPELLQVFMRVMALQPVRVLRRGQQSFTLGGV